MLKNKPSKVKLYATLSCPYCVMQENWLKEKGIEHDVVHVDLNPKEAQNIVEKTGQMGVPVTEITYNDSKVEYVIGFDKFKLQQILEIK